MTKLCREKNQGMRKIFLAIGLLYSLVCYSGNDLIKSSLFENYTVSNGLSDEKIHCVFQDSKGWIWLGTDYGVFRFDGYRFTAFNPMTETGNTLSNSLIRKIFEDNKGNLWFGTDFQGIFKYVRTENTLEQFKDKGFSHNSVWDIIQDAKGNLWLGTEGGLTYFNTNTNEVEFTYTTSNSKILPGSWIRKLFIDNQNKLWVGSNRGIVVLDENHNKVESWLTGDAYHEHENEIWEIFEDNSGAIWIGTYLGGLLKYNRNSRKLKHIILDKRNPRSETVRAVIQDTRGDIWFGTRGGLYSLSAQTNIISHYQNEVDNNYSLIHNSVLDLLIDKKGDLWVGTRNGLSYLNFDKQAFGYLSSKSGDEKRLSNGEIYVIWEDEAEQLWIGTESGGINILNKNQDNIEYLTTTNGLSSNCIKAICPDNKGNVLIGTYLGGLNMYNPATGKVKVFLHDPNIESTISDNEVWAILNDSKKRIWVGTSKGLDLFDENTQTFHHYNKSDHITNVSMIYETSKGELWIYSSDKEKLSVITPSKSRRIFDIQSRAICEDIDGNIWMGTLGNGLIKMNDKGEIIETFTTADGLSSNILNGIIDVNNEYLWISSNNGISKFNIEKHDIKNYFVTDGLLNNKFNYGAFYKTRNNSLVFGGNKGVDFVFLDKLNRNDYIPPIVITGFRVFNKEINVSPTGTSGLLTNLISETKSIVLNYNQNMISFDFAALNYANSKKNKYKYKLEGFDKDWNDIGTNRLATYTNLEHGEYNFRVVGSNNDHVYNEAGVELAITIMPPFWKTWWFRSLAILVMLLLLFLIYRMIRNREKLKQELIYERQTARKMHEVDRLKHQFFMNISHEIRTPLSLIVGPLDKIISMGVKDKVISTNLQLIKRNTGNLKKLVSQLLDYRKLETGNLKLELQKGNLRVFLEEIVDSFRAPADEKGVSVEFIAFQPNVFAWFDGDKTEKITNNLISNALKYTHPGGSITVSLSMVLVDDIDNPNLLIPPMDTEQIKYKKYLKIKVVDTGIGIPNIDLPRIFDRFRRINNVHEDQAQGAGIGLALTKELVKLHDGHIKVRSKIGIGSRFSVFIPFMEKTDEIPENDEANLDGEKFEFPMGAEKEENPNQLLALVVDDNTDLREFIKSHFEPEYKIIEAKNGKEGWERALQEIPDIIIADVMMPVMNGNELCKKIKRDERTSHIPVIMLSALGSTASQIAGIDAGADDYLTKPFDVGLLKAKTDNILSIRKVMRERYSKEMVLKPKDIILSSPDEKFLKKLINLVEKHLSNEELDVEFLSQNLDVSRTQLYRKISALTDMTPKEFVKDLRLKRAAQLISQNKLNISEVAYDIGFSDVSYFRKCFREKFGVSASEYKHQHKEE